MRGKKRDSGNIALVKEENVLCKECGDNCERIFSSNEHFELLYFLGLLLNYICVVGIGPIYRLSFPPKIRTGAMTQDLRESYDINFAKINVKRNGVNIHEFQVSPMSRKYLLFRGT